MASEESIEENSFNLMARCIDIKCHRAEDLGDLKGKVDLAYHHEKINRPLICKIMELSEYGVALVMEHLKKEGVVTEPSELIHPVETRTARMTENKRRKHDIAYYGLVDMGTDIKDASASKYWRFNRKLDIMFKVFESPRNEDAIIKLDHAIGIRSRKY